MWVLAGPEPVEALVPAALAVRKLSPWMLRREYCFWLLPDCWGFMVRVIPPGRGMYFSTISQLLSRM